MSWKLSNNKEIKKWTLANGKILKKITLANGKVLNFGATTPSIKTITANMYSSAVISSHYNIAISFTDTSVWDALHPGAVTTTLLPEKIIFEVKEEIEVLPYVYFTLINITTHKGFNVNYSGNGFTLKAGHKYQFESGKDPVDLGEYETTPSVPSGPIIKATEYTGDIAESSGYAIRVQNITNAWFKAATAAGSTETISFDIEIRTTAQLSFNNISTFRITDIVNRNHLDIHMPNDAVFTLQNGHKYHIEHYKLPVDLGTY